GHALTDAPDVRGVIPCFAAGSPRVSPATYREGAPSPVIPTVCVGSRLQACCPVIPTVSGVDPSRRIGGGRVSRTCVVFCSTCRQNQTRHTFVCIDYGVSCFVVSRYDECMTKTNGTATTDLARRIVLARIAAGLDQGHVS